MGTFNMTTKIKSKARTGSKPNAAGSAREREEKQERLDGLLTEVATDLQHAFDSLGARVRVSFERKSKGKTS
jgi:hypothetical protein